MGILPGLTTNNASVDILDDGTAELTFTVVDSSSDLNGEVFTLLIPPVETELLTEEGKFVQGTLAIGELTSDKPKRMQRQWPSITMEYDEESLAYFDWVHNTWVPRYEELLTNLGSQEIAEWMPQNLGLVEEHFFWGLFSPGISEVELIGENFHSDGYNISMILQPHRVFEEQIYDGGTIVRTENWAEMIYDDDGHSLLLLVYSSDRDVLNGINALTQNGFVNTFVNWNDHLRVEKGELFDFMDQSPRARIMFHVWDALAAPEVNQFVQDLNDSGQSALERVRVSDFDNLFFFLN